MPPTSKVFNRKKWLILESLRMYPFKLHSNDFPVICHKNKPFFAETLKAKVQWQCHQSRFFCIPTMCVLVININRSDPIDSKSTTFLKEYDPFTPRSYTQLRTVNYRAVGKYDSAPIDHIAIYKFKDKTELSHILYHEIGHHVFKRYLDSVKRKEWVTKVYPNSDHVSEYAKTNVSEDFAETYTFYIANPTSLVSIPSKLKFMQKCLPT
jgi:hypothetical protein